MAFTIKSPKFSFIQFGNEQFNALPVCDGTAKYVLPVETLSDISFQIFVEATAPDLDNIASLVPELYIVAGLHSTYPGGGASVTLSNVRRYMSNATTAVFLLDQVSLETFADTIGCDKCFQLWFKVGSTYYPSNIFQRICNTCHTAVLTYYCEENSYDFNYCSDDFANKVRLPIKLLRPQFIDQDVIYQKSDGRRKVLSSVTSKERELLTDWNNETFHERLKVALSHDEVEFADDLYTLGIVKTGAYEIEWPEFLNHPLGQARVKVNESPYKVRNTHCVDCVNADQMQLVNDVIPGDLQGGGSYNINTATNDKVFCHPAIYAIHSINSMYVQSATITASGQLSIQLKDPVASSTNVPLVTYKVTCQNGQFETAIVRGNVVGITPSCSNPDNVQVQSLAPETVLVQWDNVVGAVGYIVRITDINTNSFNDYIATTPFIQATPAGEYDIQVFTNCGGSTSVGTDPIRVQVQGQGGGGGPQFCYCFDLPEVYTVPEGSLCNNGSTPSC